MDKYILKTIVNGEIRSIDKMQFVGYAGEDKWMHFINTKTRKNHLCKSDQFPFHEFKNLESSVQLIFEAHD